MFPAGDMNMLRIFVATGKGCSNVLREQIGATSGEGRVALIASQQLTRHTTSRMRNKGVVRNNNSGWFIHRGADLCRVLSSTLQPVPTYANVD